MEPARDASTFPSLAPRNVAISEDGAAYVGLLKRRRTTLDPRHHPDPDRPRTLHHQPHTRFDGPATTPLPQRPARTPPGGGHAAGPAETTSRRREDRRRDDLLGRDLQHAGPS